MAVNFKNRISCNQLEVPSWSIGASFSSFGGGGFFKLCLVWRMDYPLFTFLKFQHKPKYHLSKILISK